MSKESIVCQLHVFHIRCPFLNGVGKGGGREGKEKWMGTGGGRVALGEERCTRMEEKRDNWRVEGLDTKEKD